MGLLNKRRTRYSELHLNLDKFAKRLLLTMPTRPMPNLTNQSRGSKVSSVILRLDLRMRPVNLLSLLRNLVWLTDVAQPCWLSLRNLGLSLILLAVARNKLMLNWLLPVALSMT